MKKLLLAALLMTPALGHAIDAKLGTYTSPDGCTVALFNAGTDTIIDVKAPGQSLTMEQINLTTSNQSVNGPGLCTDEETVGKKNANNVFATQTPDGAGSVVEVKCGGLLAPVDVKFEMKLAADGSVTSVQETEAIAAISIASGVSSGPIKTKKSFSCSGLKVK